MYVRSIKKSSTVQIRFKNLRNNPRVQLNKMRLKEKKQKDEWMNHITSFVSSNKSELTTFVSNLKRGLHSCI